jgi:hypothetical protein
VALKVAILCEFSGTVRDAFRRLGHDAISCDLLPTEAPGPHIQGDCLAQDWGGYDLIVAHPPCTYLCNSGVRWLHTRDGRWSRMEEAASFFRAILSLPVPRIAVENPIPHRHAKLPRYTQIVQPWQFGHGETKATCLWLKGLPLLRPTNVVAGRVARIHKASPGPGRWKVRSTTYPGIAEAMAAQWSTHIEAMEPA